MIVERAVPDNTIRMDSFRVMRRSLFSTASLYLDFSTNYGFAASIPSSASSLLTTTRASTGYADTLSGTYLPFLSGIPRITDKGLLVEEARTNSIRNNSMQGAVAGTPGTNPANVSNSALGTLTKSVVSADSQNGIDYWDIRLVGTTSNTSFNINLDGAAIIAASNGQTWTNSAFLAAVAGGFANITGIAVRMAIYDAGVVYLGEVGSPTVLNSLPSSLDTTSRKTTTGTIANASTALISPYLQFTWASGVAIDITLRIGWPQLELGAFATSPIRTTAAAATRAADVVVGPAVSVGSALTLFAEMTAGDGAAAVQAAFQVDNGSTTDRVFLWRSGTALNGNVRNSSVDTAALAGGAIANNATGKMAIAVAANDAAFCPNGGTVLTDATVTFPSGLNRVVFGQNGASGVTLNGYLRRVAYFPTRLTNAQLQSLTI